MVIGRYEDIGVRPCYGLWSEPRRRIEREPDRSPTRSRPLLRYLGKDVGQTGSRQDEQLRRAVFNPDTGGTCGCECDQA